MLTDEEYSDYYKGILRALSESSLFWIVPQVQQEVAGGRIATKSLKDISRKQLEIFEGEKEYKSTSKENIAISETYTPKEQLLILLDALEEVSNISLIKNEAFQSLKEFNRNLTSVVLVSDVGDVLPEFQADLIIQGEDSDSRLFEKLKQIAQQIKAEM